MKTFNCVCDDHPIIFFENTSCITCGRTTGYTDSFDATLAFETNSETGHYWLATEPGKFYQKCSNYSLYQACNGMIEVRSEAHDDELLCFACQFNETIPDLSVEAHFPLWRKMEAAKRRALFTLRALHLPLQPKSEENINGLSFDFITDGNADTHFESSLPDQKPVMTGHADGLITINLAEADDISRETMRINMGERYRTLLGHFRHELGHYYFDLLIGANPEKHKLCKAVFGDDSMDYQEALDRHYADGAPKDWNTRFISEYASMHPWEDWAESWAHYMHIIDTLDTANSYEVSLTKNAKKKAKAPKLHLPQDYCSEEQTSFEEIVDTWADYSVLLNSLNRSMGLKDPYPFLLTPEVINKLRFIHLTIHNCLHLWD